MGVTVVLEVRSESKCSIQQKFDVLKDRIQKKLDVESSGKYNVAMASFQAKHTSQVVGPQSAQQYPHHPPPQPPTQSYHKRFNYLTLTEYPMSTFTVYEPAPVFLPNTLQAKVPSITVDCVTIADTNFSGIIQTLMPNVFKQQKKLHVSVRGVRYTFSDFIIQCGIVYANGNQPKSLILVVEYKPALIAEMTNQLLKEFVYSLNLARAEQDMDGGYNSESFDISQGDGLIENLFSDNIEFKLSEFPTIPQEPANSGTNKNERYKVQHTILQYIDVLTKIRNQAGL